MCHDRAVDTAEFDTVVEDLDYPMFVVTTVHDGDRAGCMVGFTTQASIDPPRMLVCLSEKNYTHRVAESAEPCAPSWSTSSRRRTRCAGCSPRPDGRSPSRG